MATAKPTDNQQPNASPSETQQETVRLYGVEPPWTLYFIVRDWWRERKAKQQGSQPERQKSP